jgi:uncharacterized protein
VIIEYDPVKNKLNLARHGLSLADAAAFDLATARVMIDARHEYGEVRWRAFGRVEGKGRCLVFTYRANFVRIISYRPAHEKEMRRYE